jgi:hypothetical protein
VRRFVACFVVAACGADSRELDPCDDCLLDQACFVSTDIRGCSPVCTDNTTCGPGHACVDNDGAQLCDLHCDDSLCGGRTECRGLECEAVDCGRIVACLDTTDVCDAFAHECYPFDGNCSTATDCPSFDGAIQSYADITCASGFCGVQLAPPPFPPFASSDVEELVLAAPLDGAAVTTQDALAIGWNTSPTGTAIALVLTGVPTSDDDVLAMAVWGAATPTLGGGLLSFADGSAIVDGTWTGEPATLPTNTPLILWVEIARSGQLVAVSREIRIRIAAAWPAPGDACGDPGTIEGSCQSPIEVLGCNPATSHCAAVCESYRDCLGTGLDCGPPRGDARYCE